MMNTYPSAAEDLVVEGMAEMASGFPDVPDVLQARRPIIEEQPLPCCPQESPVRIAMEISSAFGHGLLLVLRRHRPIG